MDIVIIGHRNNKPTQTSFLSSATAKDISDRVYSYFNHGNGSDTVSIVYNDGEIISINSPTKLAAAIAIITHATGYASR